MASLPQLIFILLYCFLRQTVSEGQLQKPALRVTYSNMEVNMVCETQWKGHNITCYLYTGDTKDSYKTTWSTSRICHFDVKMRDLQRALQSEGSREVSCDYTVNSDPQCRSPRSDSESITGILPKAKLEVSVNVVQLSDAVQLKCSGHNAGPGSYCTFIFNGAEIGGSGCERPYSGSALLSGGSHSVLTNVTIRCYYSEKKDGTPPSSIYSDPYTVTVLDLIKPNVSVSTHHTETQIQCEAPSPITGALFHLYDTRSQNHFKDIQAGAGESAVTFTVPHDPNLRYCCNYQYRSFNSKTSDCVGPKEHPETGNLPKAKLEVNVNITPLSEDVKLKCSGHNTGSYCTFIFNGAEISGSDCERSFTGSALLSGRSHSVLTNVTIQCYYSEPPRSSIYSDPSTVTVLGISDWLPIVGGVLAVCVILLGATAVCLYWRCKKQGSNRQPMPPSNDNVQASYSVASKEHNKDATPSDVTYSSINHTAPQSSYPMPSQDSVVYSSLKTD
ncbi:hypothetical protein MATL_G00127500 [Megalops atlanticus]|uniref:Ig-like domain-containing protein n=1 Tax=Megalops atlanticus TaxID=7932 RepID=A0A9D3PVR6_MEGAT|nr:hypothetical protein MATL_G00127500 [Megalops atlanticus]